MSGKGFDCTADRCVPKKATEETTAPKMTLEEQMKAIADVLRDEINPVLRKAFSIYFVRTGENWTVSAQPSNEGEFIYRVAISEHQQYNVEATAAIVLKEISDFKSKKWQPI